MLKRHGCSYARANKRVASVRANSCSRPPGFHSLLPPGPPPAAASADTTTGFFLPVLLKCSQLQQIPELALKMPMKLAYWDIRGVRRTVCLTFHSIRAQRLKSNFRAEQRRYPWLLHVPQSEYKHCCVSIFAFRLRVRFFWYCAILACTCSRRARH